MPVLAPMCFGAFLQVSPVLAVFDVVADGHGPSEKSARDFGAGASASWCKRWFEVGVSARYDFAAGSGDNAHFISAPLWVAVRIPVHHAVTLRATAGVGLGLGLVAGYPDPDSTLVTLGAVTEAAVGALIQVSPELSVLVEIGARFDSLREMNTDDTYLNGSNLVHAQLPFLRAGVGW